MNYSVIRRTTGLVMKFEAIFLLLPALTLQTLIESVIELGYGHSNPQGTMTLLTFRDHDYHYAELSDDNGVTWSEPAVLCPEPRWHQSCTAVDIYNGKVTLVYEKWVADGHPWPGVGPVLMQADEGADLTLRENWRFSELYNPDADMEAARPSGIPVVGPGHAGMLETNVVRIHDESNPFYDPNSVVLMARASTGWPDIGVMLKGSVLPDGSLKIGRLHKNEGDVLFTHIPGGDLKFHVLYDAESGLYWLLHSQIDGRMNQRRRLALSYSPDLILCHDDHQRQRLFCREPFGR